MLDDNDTYGGIQDNDATFRGFDVSVADILSHVPRSGSPLGEGGPSLCGTVLLGVAQPHGGRWLQEVVFVERDRVLSLTARFPDRDSSLSFERKLEMRAGPWFGRLRNDRAAGLLTLLIADHLGRKAHRPYPSVTLDAVRGELEAYVAGHPLDESRLYGTTAPFGDALDCGDGWAWRRVLTYEGAMAVTMDALHPVALDWLDQSALVEACVPVAAYYALMRGPGALHRFGAVVEIPHPKSGYPPVVGGVVGRDPFIRHADAIAVLSKAIGIGIGPEHRLHPTPPEGKAGEG